MIEITRLSLIFLSFSVIAKAQNTSPPAALSDWQKIAMINEVWYKDGSRYVHSSFEYAGTGFLLDTGQDTIAITAKHILWIAQPKQLETVAINGEIDKWWLHPKGDSTIGVYLDQLLNEDAEEMLGGPSGTIGQRDWLIFSIKEKLGNLPALKARYTPVEEGEKLFYPACPYQSKDCILGEAEVLSAKGNRIVFTKEVPGFIGGASGSPLVDSQGRVVGVLGGTSVHPDNGDPALYGISTHYLKKVLTKSPHLNDPLIPVGDVLWPILNAKGIAAALTHWRSLKQSDMAHFYLDLLPEAFNQVGKELLELEQFEQASTWFEASFADNPWISSTRKLLAQAYEQQGKKEQARRTLQKLLEKWPEDKEAKEALERLGR
ncbi:MAG: tetratricopeptide repeat protein [Saprospiraceae bacterium]|nr:tetratricopeptide repeat protein [Saprospiraceae bacterium]